jgi:hypothetical protein
MHNRQLHAYGHKGAGKHGNGNGSDKANKGAGKHGNGNDWGKRSWGNNSWQGGHKSNWHSQQAHKKVCELFARVGLCHIGCFSQAKWS